MKDFICSGYTEFIRDGRIDNAKDFLKLCLRNFGVMYKYREEPLGIIEPSFNDNDELSTENQTKKKVESLVHNIKKKISMIESFPIEDFIIQNIAEYQDILDERRQELKEAIDFSNKLESIKQDIIKWNAENEFDEVKTFALTQIDNAMNCIYIKTIEREIKDCEEIISKLQNKSICEKTAQSIKEGDIRSLELEIEYYNEYHNNEKTKLDNEKKAKEFYDGFIKSIEII